MRKDNHTKSSLLIASAAAALIAIPAASQAHGMSGMHGNFGGTSASHISASGLANGNGANATTRVYGQDRADLRHTMHDSTDVTTRTDTTLGGNSAAHISANGLANTNGPNASTRLHGTARADARHTLHATNHPNDNDTDDNTTPK